MTRPQRSRGRHATTADGVGLTGERASVGPSTLITTATGGYVLRTPSRPDFRNGNALHLPAPSGDPAADLARFDDLIGGTVPGADRRLRWEDPRPGAAAPPAVQQVTRDRGGWLTSLAVMQLTGPLSTPGRLAGVEPVLATREQHWAGAAALDLHGRGPGSRADEQGFFRWRTGQVAQLARVGCARLWLVKAAGVPAAKVTIVRGPAPGGRARRGGSGETGLGWIASVVTHPLHRRRGLATSLVHHAVTVHRREHPDDLVGVAAGRSAERLYARLGFEGVATGHVLDVPRAAAL